MISISHNKSKKYKPCIDATKVCVNYSTNYNNLSHTITITLKQYIQSKHLCKK